MSSALPKALRIALLTVPVAFVRNLTNDAPFLQGVIGKLHGFTVAVIAAVSLLVLLGFIRHKAQVIAVMQDEIRRRQGDAKLLRLQTSALNSTANAVLIADVNHTMLWVNPAFTKMTGYSADETVGKTPYELFNDLEDKQFLAEMQRTIRSGKVWQGEIRSRKKDGTFYVKQTTITPVHGDEGQVTHFIGVNVDVTQRKVSEEALQRSEASLRSLVHNAPYGIFRSTEDGSILSGNPKLCEILGCTSEADLLSHNLNDFYFNPEDRPTVLRALCAGDGLRNLELNWKRKDGTPIRVRTDGHVHSREGNGPVFEGFIVDITESRRAEQELRRLNRALGTLSKCNEALVRAQSESELVNSICQLLVEVGGHRMAWVGYAEHNPEKRIRPVALAGFDDGYAEHGNLTFGGTTRGNGPAGLAIRTERVQILHNNDKEPTPVQDWQQEALKRGYLSTISLPLRDGSSVFGALTIHASDVDAFDEKETELLTELASDLAYGIVSLRNADKRRVAEHNLRESEQRYRGLFVRNPHPMWVFDVETQKFVDVNDAALSHYGYSREEFLTLTTRDIRPAEDVDAHLKGLSDASPGYQFRGAFRHLKNDGTVFDVEVTSYRFLQDGRLLTLALVNDITERKRAEEALRKSEERFQLASRATQDVVWDWDVKNDYVWYSDRFWELFGYDPATFPTSTDAWATLIHPEDSWVLAPQYDEYTSNEYRMKRADGTWAHVLDRAYLICDEKGERVRKVGIFSDITRSKEAEIALRESEARYRTLFEQGFIGVFYSCPGRILDCNDAMCRMLGYTREELLALDVLQLYDNLTDREAGMARLFQEHQVANYQIQLRRKDGSAISVLANLTLIVPKPGHEPMIAGVVLDITETRALQEQLLQAQKLEAIGRLTGGVAHDFNNILMIISSYGEILLETAEPENPVHEYINQIRTAVDRGASLTRQLLAFSRKQVLKPVIVKMETVLAELRDVLRRLIGEDISLKVSWEDALWPVKADPSQIQQVIFNLAVNARDAMPAGGTLTIKARNVELGADFVRSNNGSRAGEYVALSVSDTGCGIAREIQSHVFEPFFTTKERGKGTGLGLSTVYGIVKQSDGYITLESDAGRGATFVLYLPRESELSEPAFEAHTTSVHAVSRSRVLLVEDEDATRSAIAHYLEQNGFEVSAAENGQSALKICTKAGEQPFDVLLTDVVMPGVSGIEVARTFSANHPHARIVFMSGYTDDQLVRSGIRDWPQADLIYKPFRLPELVKALSLRDVAES